MSRPKTTTSLMHKGDRPLTQHRGTQRRKWLKMMGPLLVSVPFLLLFLFLPVTLAQARPGDDDLTFTNPDFKSSYKKYRLHRHHADGIIQDVNVKNF